MAPLSRGRLRAPDCWPSRGVQVRRDMTRTRPVVLAFLGPYWPAAEANGPVRSLRELVRALTPEFEFRIVGRDRPYEAAHSSAGVATRRWLPHEGGYVRHEAPEDVSVRFVSHLMRTTPHDILYINSLFEREFSIVPLLARRFQRKRIATIVAPRGELAEGALRIKRKRKLAYLAFAKLLGLHAGVAFQATNDFERDEIRQRFPGNAIFACPNVSPMPSPRIRSGPAPDPLRIVYLSRIARKKNLDLALRILASLQTSIVFDIYGPISESSYWRECQPLIASLPPNIKATYRGPVRESEVAATLAEYDLFFLPTAGENFGHAIVEAMASGLPVLISDRTPWHGLQAAQAGFDLPLEDPRAFGQAISSFRDLDAAQRAALGAGAARYIRRAVDVAQSVNAHRTMFEAVLSGAPPQ